MTTKAAFQRWHYFVCSYSALLLTYEKDKLVAIAGLASRLAKWTGSVYLAGIWSENLAEDLLWMRRYSHTPLKRLQRPRAPSFSWASVNGTVEFPLSRPVESNGPRTCRIKLVDAFCKTEPGNEYGMCEGGFIRLEGHLVPIIPLLRGHIGFGLAADGQCEQTGYTAFYPDTMSSDRLWRRLRDQTARESHRTPSGQGFQHSTIALLVITYRDYHIFLILERSMHSLGYYERIGAAQYWSRTSS